MSIGDCKMQNELGRVRYHFAFFNTQFAIVLALRRFAPAQGSPGGESPFQQIPQKGPTLTSTRDYTQPVSLASRCESQFITRRVMAVLGGNG